MFHADRTQWLAAPPADLAEARRIGAILAELPLAAALHAARTAQGRRGARSPDARAAAAGPGLRCGIG